MLKQLVESWAGLLPAFTLFIALATWTHAADNTLPPREGDPSIKATDYSDTNNWMIVTPNPTHPVDIFLYYPTAYEAKEGGSNVATIDDQGMRNGAQDFMKESGSAIATEELGNVFVPYYRQIDAIWGLRQTQTDQDQYFNGIPRTDALAAFEYYLQHYNQGRPFIIVGHSQGTLMSKRLLFGYLKNRPEVYRRLIAGYLIGISITKKELADNPHVRFAENADDTGVVISYNTQAEQTGGPNPTWLEGSIAINPITWTRGGDLVPASANLGSHLKGASGDYEKVLGIADARVDVERGLVICSTVDPEKYSFESTWRKTFPLGVYHHYDLPFYYYNLRENARNRIAKFLEANPQYKK